MALHFWRWVRGLVGTAITWGAVGAFIGVLMFMARYQPWSSSAMQWDRMMKLLGAFLGGGALWGSACGLAFGLAVWSATRNERIKLLSARRLTLWGAVAGAAFPLLLYTPVVLRHGAFSAIPFYAMLTGLSAVFGAVCGRAIFALAKREPQPKANPAALTASPLVDDPEVHVVSRERVL